MQSFTDPTYLRKDQYGDAHHLDARVALHTLYSTNPYGWQRWLFEQLPLTSRQRVLELGCGPGYLWSQNVERLPANLDLMLSDFSTGMLEEARTRLEGLRDVRFEMIDAQQIPYPSASFDLLIANHMLYHIPDRQQALHEISRVTKPRGFFCASTVGTGHMRELAELVREFDPKLPTTLISQSVAFTLQSGGSELREHFRRVDRFIYADALEITQAAPLVAYVASTAGQLLSGDRMIAFRRFVEETLSAHQSIHVTKESGVFLCVK
jgi:ubiquinone/menaquinone biosynthesis C-methylase UbiE